MKTKLVILLALLTITFSCKEEKQTQIDGIKKEEIHHKDNHWSYEGETGPEHWAELEKDNDCTGLAQSPINIIHIDATYDSKLKPLDIQYSPSTKIKNVTNNGHSIQYNFEKQDYIILNGERYELNQIHFHESSEHTINGIRYPMEIHFVHLNEENKIAVLGIMVQEGASSEAFEFLEKYLPLENGQTKEINLPFDLNVNLPKNKKYYSYKGSLTTPPCTEDVSWFIFKEPITISIEQVEKIRAIMPLNNYRPEQKLNGRIVKKSFQ